MLAELYDSTAILLAVATALCAMLIYPVVGWWATALYIAWGSSIFLASSIDSYVDHTIVRTLYVISHLATGFTAILTTYLSVAVLATVLVSQYTAFQVANTLTATALIAAGLTAIGSVAYAYVIKTTTSHIAVLDHDVAHISDLHLGASHGQRRLERVVDRIEAINPAFTVITGDVFDGSGWPAQGVLDPLSRLDNVYASLGNHDYYHGAEDVESRLEQVGVTVLRNEVVDHGDVAIGGVDDIEFPDEVPGESIAALQPSDEQTSILLYHRPREVDAFQESSFDLMLSGHTHGGQILPLRVLLGLFTPYLSGTFDIGDGVLNVTTGAGTGGPIMRLGTTCEVCHLTP